jgi:hypothetical protein
MNETFFPSAGGESPRCFASTAKRRSSAEVAQAAKRKDFVRRNVGRIFTPPSQRREPHVGDSEPIDIEQPSPDISTSEAPEGEYDFKWQDKLVVVPAQPAIAVYFNPCGDVVIRQQGPYGYHDDQWIYVQIKNLGPLIDQLQRIARGEITMD